MKQLSFSVLFCLTSFAFCAEQRTKRFKEDKEIILKTQDEQKLIALQDFLEQSETIQNMQTDIGDENTIIPLPYQYCTSNIIKIINKSPFFERENYSELKLKELIQCCLAASFLQMKNCNKLYPIISSQFETSADEDEKMEATLLVNNDNILKDYLKQKWGVYFNKIKEFQSLRYYTLSPDGKYIVTINRNMEDGTIFNTETKTMLPFSDQKTFYNLPAINPNSTLISSAGVVADDDYGINIWDIKTGKVIHKFLGHTQINHQVCFLPENNLVASSSYDKTLKIWCLNTKECLGTYPSSIRFSVHPTKNIILYSPPESNTLKLINISEKTTTNIELDFLALEFIFSPDGASILANNVNSYIDKPKKVALIDLKDGNKIKFKKIPADITILQNCYINNKIIALTYMSPNTLQPEQKEMITCLWDSQNDTIIKSIKLYLLDISFSHPYLYGKNITSYKINFFDATTLKEVPFEFPQLQDLKSISCSKNNKYMVLDSYKETILFEKMKPKENETILKLLRRWKERKQ